LIIRSWVSQNERIVWVMLRVIFSHFNTLDTCLDTSGYHLV